MKYAVIQLGGKQLMVSEGTVFEIERQAKISPEVLLFSDEGKVLLGEPILSDVTVKTTVVTEKMGDKVRVARFRAKSRYDKVKGHKQPLTVVKVDSISLKGTEKTDKSEKSDKDTPAKEAKVKKEVAKATEKKASPKKSAAKKVKETK